MTWQLIDGVIVNDAFATPASARTSVLVDGINNAGFQTAASATAQPVDAILGLTTWASSGGAIYVLSASGTISFSGTGPYTRQNVFPASGTVQLTGISLLLKTRTQPVSGTITFSGTSAQRRIRLTPSSGTETFSGSAGITFVPAALPITYTIVPSGGIAYNGTALFLRIKTQVVSGLLLFSGTAPYNFNRTLAPVGFITFFGTAPINTNNPVLTSTTWRALTGSGV